MQWPPSTCTSSSVVVRRRPLSSVVRRRPSSSIVVVFIRRPFFFFLFLLRTTSSVSGKPALPLWGARAMATLHTHLFLFIRRRLSSSAYFLSFSSLFLLSLLPPHPVPSPDYSPPSHASSSSSNLLPSFFFLVHCARNTTCSINSNFDGATPEKRRGNILGTVIPKIWDTLRPIADGVAPKSNPNVAQHICT